ncbi:MAG: imidazole glycerol phosphate synthase subunit HisH [Acidobacteriota bacterium]
MPVVTVIDYGMGNLLSVGRAFEQCGAEVVFTDVPEQVVKSDFLVLPGVGAFADGMAELQQRGLVDAIKQYCTTGRGFLGICLGMQMMLDASEEFGEHRGLGLIPGRVAAIPNTGSDGKPHKIPHIGWNGLVKPASDRNWSGSILDGIPEGTSYYFVHSFTAVPDKPEHRLADCLYNGCLVSAAIRSGSLYGCQFHPEKSGEMGLRIIKNILSL